MRTIGLVNVDKTEFIIIENIPVQDGILVYDPNEPPREPNWLYYSSEQLTLTITPQTRADEYTAKFKPKPGYRWADNTDKEISVKWKIDPKKISVVPSQDGSIPFDGDEHRPTWLNYDPNQLEISGDVKGTEPGTYRVLFKPKDSYIWDPEITVVEKGYQPAFWKIGKIIIAEPHIVETEPFPYDQTYHTIHISMGNTDDWKYIEQTGLTSSRDKGVYKITWKLKYPDKAIWSHNKTEYSEFWSVGLTVVTIPKASKTTFGYSPGVTHALDIKGEKYDTSGKLLYITRHGATALEDAGLNYSVWYELKDPENSVWEDSTKGYQYINWQITPAQVIRPSWKSGVTTNFPYVKGTTRVIKRSTHIKGYDADLMVELGEFSADKKGIYTIIYSLKNNPNYCWDTGDPYEDTRLFWYIGVATLDKPNISGDSSFEYNGSPRGPEIANEPSSEVCLIAGTKAETNVGDNYQISYTIKDTDAYCWAEDGSTDPVVLSWSVTHLALDRVKPVQLSYSMQTGGVDLQVTGYQPTYMTRSNYHSDIVGNFTAVYALKNSNLIWKKEKATDSETDPITIDWKVVGSTVEKKEFYQEGRLIYTGDPLQVQVTNYNSTVMVLTGELEKTKVGNDYVCYVGLKSGYVWDDGTEDPVPVRWTIEQRQLPVPAANPAINTYTGSDITVNLTNYTPKYWTEEGMTESELGDYVAVLTLKDTSQTVWAPSDEYNKVLLHFNNISNPGYDECGNSWTCKNVTINSTLYKFDKAAQVSGNASMTMDIPIPLGGQDFTIDFWFYMKQATSYTDGSQGYLYFITAVDNTIKIYCHRTANGANTGNITCGFWVSGGPSGEGKSYSRIYQDCRNAWHHIAYVYKHSNSTIYCFFDGVQKFATAKSIARRLMNFQLFNNGTNGLVGAMDEFRVSDGIARWTSNFNSQLPTTPYEYTWANPTAPAEIAWSIRVGNIPKPYAEKTEFEYDTKTSMYSLRLFNENFNYMTREGPISKSFPDSCRATYTREPSTGTVSCNFPGTMNFTYNLTNTSTTGFDFPETKTYSISFRKKSGATYTNAPTKVNGTLSVVNTTTKKAVLTVPKLYDYAGTENGVDIYELSTDSSITSRNYPATDTVTVSTTSIALPLTLTEEVVARPGVYTVTYTLIPELGLTWATSGTDTNRTDPVVITWKINGTKLTKEQGIFEQTEKLTYDKKQTTPYEVSCVYNSKLHILLNGQLTADGVGTYHATFIPQSGYCWYEGGTEERYLTWTVDPIVLPVPDLAGKTSFQYTGSDITVSPTNTRNLTANGDDLTQKYVGTYVRDYYVPNTQEYIFSNSKTTAFITWEITPHQVSKPNPETSFSYTGESYRPTSEYDESPYVIVGGTDTAINAGYYTATYTVDSTTAVWIEDNVTSTGTIPVGWRIDRQELSKTKSIFTPGTFEATVNNVVTDKLDGYDSDCHIVTGTTTASDVGTYTCYVTPKSNYCWNGSTDAQKLPDATQAQKPVTWTVGTTSLDIVIYDYDNNQQLTSLTISDGATQRHIYAVNAGNVPVPISYKVDNTEAIAVVQNTALSSTGRTDFIISAQNSGECTIKFTRAASGNYDSAVTKFKIISEITTNISSYTDGVGNEFKITGNPIVDSTYAKFGTSVQVTPNNTLDLQGINLGTGNITIEFWGFLPTLGMCTFFFMKDTLSTTSGSTDAICNYYNVQYEMWTPKNSGTYYKNGIEGFTANVWHHSAMVYTASNTTWTLYFDGTKKHSLVNPLTKTTYSHFVIGGKFRHAAVNVYIDEFRISNVARYTGSSYTVPTKEFTKDANTLVLCHF